MPGEILGLGLWLGLGLGFRVNVRVSIIRTLKSTTKLLLRPVELLLDPSLTSHL